ncbi:hypothetical protein DFJ74DRAFT_648786, partial [Hyaloraphidium curvatum]
MDFPNHHLVHPSPWDRPEAVAMIAYFDDATDCGGRTALVKRRGGNDPDYKLMRGFGLNPWINNRILAEKDLETRDPEAFELRRTLYAREEYLDFRVGTILFHRLDLWHPGTPLLPGRSRAVVNMMYKSEAAGFRITSWHVGWAANAYSAWAAVPPDPPERGKFEEMLERMEGGRGSCWGSRGKAMPTGRKRRQEPCGRGSRHARSAEAVTWTRRNTPREIC